MAFRVALGSHQIEQRVIDYLVTIIRIVITNLYELRKDKGYVMKDKSAFNFNLLLRFLGCPDRFVVYEGKESAVRHRYKYLPLRKQYFCTQM